VVNFAASESEPDARPDARPDRGSVDNSVVGSVDGSALGSVVGAELLGRGLAATDVSVVVTDARAPGEPIVWVIDAFARITGYAREEVLGRSARLLQGPGTDPDAARVLADGTAAGRAVTVTVLHYRRDGRPFWNQTSVSPIHDDDGRLTHSLGILVDVTGQVEAGERHHRAAAAERRRGTGLGLVAQVSDLLADLDDPHTLRDIADLLMHRVVAWAGFFLDDGGLRVAEGVDLTDGPTSHRRRHGPAPERTVHQQALELESAGAAVEAPPDPVQRLLDGTVEGPVDVDLARAGPDTRTAAGWLAHHLGPVLAGLPGAPTTVTVLPVPGRRRALGVLVVVLAPPQDDDAVLTVLHLTARRVGMAVENVRLYAREHRLAETLQRAMLPEQVEVPGLDVWSYYAPSAAHAQVGGDWYDVLQVNPDVVGVVVGDVVGHDIEAAASMGQLRSVVRAYAYGEPRPGVVLEHVDRLVAGMRIPRSASLVLSALGRTEDGGWELDYSRAGHLPPVLVRDGAVRQLTGGSGPLIGFGDGPRAAGHEDLQAGDVLVLYTDGLVERRDRTLREGVAALVDACGEVTAADAAGIGEELLSRLADAPEDDVAVVVVRLPTPGAGTSGGAGDPRRRRWLLPSEPASIAKARHAVLRTCQAWGLTDVASAELVVSELMANAVLHGWGHLSLRLYGTGDGLRIEVEDANPAPPVATDGHPGRVGGYGIQIVERLADWGWRPSGAGKVVWARIRPTGGPTRRA
jgi:PAS domain S-box-containing protein